MTGTDLPPYSGSKAECRKCRTPAAATIYHRERKGCMCWADNLVPDPNVEHHFRHCRNCGYQWAEATTDSEAPTAERRQRQAEGDEPGHTQ